MDCLWNHAEAPQWRAFHEQCAGPLPQSWRYGEALASLGTTVHRAWLLDSEGPVAAAQFVCRRIAGYLSLALCSRGPLWRADLAPDRRREAYRLIRRTLPIRPWRVPLYSPEQIADELDPIEVKDMRRVMTGYSTVMLDLDQSAEQLMSGLEPKWRNRLRRAQGETGLQVFINTNRERCDWLIEREREQRVTRRFFGLPTGFVKRWIDLAGRDEPAFLLGRAEYEGRTVAGMLFLLHGRSATYHIGWADSAGRELNAHNRILWESIEPLRARRIDRLDLGGVNTHGLAGISRFKLGTGGRVVRLAGTWH